MRARRGVTLVEIAIVVALIGILAAIGAGMMTELMPSWRTRRAAREFAAQASQARSMAIADNVQYRIWLEETDPDPTTSATNHGIYWVQKGDLAAHSTAWNTLPVEMTGVDDLQGEGYVNIQKDAEDSLPWVSIEALPDTLAGTDSWTDSIIFNPRGMLDNPASDYDCDINGDSSADGYICVTFVNQKAALSGKTDEWIVAISRAGAVRLQHGTDDAVGYPAGAQITSQGGSGGDGYAGGS